ALVSHRTISIIEVAVNFDGVPLLGMTNIVDSKIIVLAPKKGHSGEWLTLAQDISRRYLALALRNHPMFHADFFPGIRIRPACDITYSKDARGAVLKIWFDRNPRTKGQASLFGQRQRRTHAHSEHDEVCIE